MQGSHVSRPGANAAPAYHTRFRALSTTGCFADSVSTGLRHRLNIGLCVPVYLKVSVALFSWPLSCISASVGPTWAHPPTALLISPPHVQQACTCMPPTHANRSKESPTGTSLPATRRSATEHEMQDCKYWYVAAKAFHHYSHRNVTVTAHWQIPTSRRMHERHWF